MRSINQCQAPAIIIAGSGMCTGGRIKHHLAQNITRPECAVLFVGYQAAGTLGLTILERPKTVRILGKTYPVKARIEKINGYADKKELLRWVGALQSPPQKIFVVHGEEKVMTEYVQALQQAVSTEIVMPEYQQAFQL